MLALQPDGKILLGGDFTSINGTSINRIARLNADGSLDNTFNLGSGASSTVNTMTLQSDGKMVLGGNFSSFNSNTVNGIARLNADGSHDESFDAGSGVNNRVNASLIQPDGKIIIAGYFTTVNGSDMNRIARLNPDGTLDATFDPGTGADDGIQTITLQSDNNIVIGGAFNSIDGLTYKRVARLLNQEIENTVPAMVDQQFTIYENSPTGTEVGTVAATDVLTFSIVSGNTGGAFSLDASTGVLTVSVSSVLDYETVPVFSMEVEVSDGESSTSATITVKLIDVDEIAPTFTSSNSASVAENSSGTIYTATADEAVTFTLGDSKDETLFTLSNDNEVSFTASPDFESPQDGDGDNVYQTDVIVTDAAGNVSTLEVTITVTDLDEVAPSFISSSTVSVAENTTTTVYTSTADEAVIFTLGDSKDGALFTLSNGNEISFTSAPDFEDPLDGDGDNVYEVELIATDASGNFSSLVVSITVANVDEESPIITSPSSVSVAENSIGDIYTAMADEAVTFTLGMSQDEGLFAHTGGVLSFKSSPDYEQPADGDGDNIYEVELIATDEAGNYSSQNVSIAVTNIEERLTQVIAFDALDPVVYGVEPLQLSAEGGESGNPLTFTSSHQEVAEVSKSNQLIINGAGTAQIKVNQAGNADYFAANEKTQTIEVSKAELNAKAQNAEKIYGQENPPFTVEYEGFVNGEDISALTGLATATTTATTGSGVGSYPITVTDGVADNYIVVGVAGELSVKAALLSVLADDKEMMAGDVLPELTMTIQGWVNNDDESDIILPSIATEATPISSPGSYLITLSGGSADNYQLELVEGTLIIMEVLGVDQIDGFEVYPNPASSSIRIDLNTQSKIASLDIYNLQGLWVMALEPRTGIHEVETLKTGLYMLAIKTDKGVTVRKFKKD